MSGVPGSRTANPERGDLSWLNKARCKDTYPDRFFATTSDRQHEAVTFCLACPVRLDCLGYAIRNGYNHGIWGGTTEAERARIRKGRTA